MVKIFDTDAVLSGYKPAGNSFENINLCKEIISKHLVSSDPAQWCPTDEQITEIVAVHLQKHFNLNDSACNSLLDFYKDEIEKVRAGMCLDSGAWVRKHLSREEYVELLKKKVQLNYNTKIDDAKKFIHNYLLDERKDYVEDLLETVFRPYFDLKTKDMKIVTSYYKAEKKAYDSAKAKQQKLNDLKIDSKYDGMYTMHTTNSADDRVRINPHADKIADMILRENYIVTYKDTMFVYRDGFYRQEEETIHDIALNILADICKGDNSDHMDQKIKDVMIQVRTKSRVFEYPFNNYRNVLPVENGCLVFDFDNGKCWLESHNPETYKFNYKVPMIYDSEIQNDVYLDMFRAYTLNEKEPEKDNSDRLLMIPAQSFMQAMGHGPYKRATLIYGKKNSGKTTFIDLLEDCVGKSGFCDVSLDKIAQRFQLASLEGRLLNMHDDMGYFTLSDTGTFKTLTGKNQHDVERKGVQPYTANLSAVHVFTTNTPAKFDGRVKADEAFWERWNFITFSRNFAITGDFKQVQFTPENRTALLNHIVKMMLRMGKEKRLPVEADWYDVREKWMLAGNPLYSMVNELMDPAIREIDSNDKRTKGTAFIKEELLKLLQKWCMTNNMDSRAIPDSVKDLTGLVEACGWETEAKKKFTNSGKDYTHCYIIPFVWKDTKQARIAKEQITGLATTQDTLN